MANFTAIIEQAADGSWSACTLGEHTVLGQGESKDAALADLRSGLEGLIEHLKETGQPLPISSPELVNVEVAA